MVRQILYARKFKSLHARFTGDLTMQLHNLLCNIRDAYTSSNKKLSIRNWHRNTSKTKVCMQQWLSIWRL